MAMDVDVFYTPADFEALSRRDLGATVCVVFDVLRATTSMLTALANGAREIIPVAEISEALEFHARNPGVILAGERHGARIRGDRTGGIDFHLGNSPREFTADQVRGKTVVTTTTNGTRALRACTSARRVFASAFLNLQATAEAIVKIAPEELAVVCGGTFETAAYEDVLAAGALLERIAAQAQFERASDGALMARKLYQAASADLLAAVAEARNGAKLLSLPELRDDVPFCLQIDSLKFTASLRKDGTIQRD